MNERITDPGAVVQRLMEAYNRRDLEGFCACFAPDAVLGDLNGDVAHRDNAGVRERYATLFAQHPENRAELVNRIACGNVVVDEERILRGKGVAPFRALAIYTVKSGLIARVDFVR